MSGTVHLGRTVPTQDRNGRTHLLLGTPPWRCIRIMRRGLLAWPPPAANLCISLMHRHAYYVYWAYASEHRMHLVRAAKGTKRISGPIVAQQANMAVNTICNPPG